MMMMMISFDPKARIVGSSSCVKKKKKGELCYPGSKMLAGGYLNNHTFSHLELLSKMALYVPFSSALDLIARPYDHYFVHADIWVQTGKG